MSQVITIPFTEPFIERLSDFIHDQYPGNDLRRLNVVFGGRRPALFLKRTLAKRIQGVFFPPHISTIDDFITRIAQGQARGSLLDLDDCYLLFGLAQMYTPKILEGRSNFAQFLPWAREILAFIEQLDLEAVQDDALKVLQAHADIGFNVPDDINRLLQEVLMLRHAYHAALDEQKLISRGYRYLNAPTWVERIAFDEYDHILFCNFVYVHRTEMSVMRHLYERDKASLIMQGDQRRWPALKRIANVFSVPIVEGANVIPTTFNLKMYAAFDMHSQAGLVSEILKSIKDVNNTVIVLPNPDFMLPLLSAISDQINDFNISIGYPLKRSSLYALLDFIVQAQISRKAHGYYSRDYLKVLRHPLIINMPFILSNSVTRVFIYKLEECLTGIEMTMLSGRLFLDVEDILKDEALFESVIIALRAMDITVESQELKDLISTVHRLVFSQWEDLTNFETLAQSLMVFLDSIEQNPCMNQYPFNERIIDSMRAINLEFAAASFGKEHFSPIEIFRIVLERLANGLVALKGSPLKGLQILGLFETRSLSFDHVIVVDVNEGVLPNLNVYEPLIPREVMVKLNLDRLELEEEIQRYQFMRLISSAKNVHLIYQERVDKERSRFVEELVWEQECAKSEIGAVKIVRPSFMAALNESKRCVPKKAKVLEFLRGFTFSASSVNTYLRNPYEFYTNYVLDLKEKDDLLDDPESRHIGTFVHGLMEHAFRPFIGRKPVIDDDFRRHFMRMFETQFSQMFRQGIRSDAFLMKAVLEHRLLRFLDVEALRLQTDVKELLGVERKFDDTIALTCGLIRFSYRVDRLERLEDDSMLIIDYKTGAMETMPNSFEMPNILSRQVLYERLNSFQMPLYLYYLNKQYPNQAVNASIYHLRTMTMAKMMTQKTMMNQGQLISNFIQALDFIMSELFNPEIPFLDEAVDIQ